MRAPRGVLREDHSIQAEGTVLTKVLSQKPAQKETSMARAEDGGGGGGHGP